ncbi:hypothetical protein DdX_19059 [Ditylenchus destructor]|uniref:Uncharacterized protein n=1 Tax=Ditylenchus destructor TaxID=166010 RepID=A0AAD4QSG8_9BILA|nr:hypothetical protein DdX_19059 [Ditylenchus destructor]
MLTKLLIVLQLLPYLLSIERERVDGVLEEFDDRDLEFTYENTLDDWGLAIEQLNNLRDEFAKLPPLEFDSDLTDEIPKEAFITRQPQIYTVEISEPSEYGEITLTNGVKIMFDDIIEKGLLSCEPAGDCKLNHYKDVSLLPLSFFDENATKIGCSAQLTRDHEEDILRLTLLCNTDNHPSSLSPLFKTDAIQDPLIKNQLTTFKTKID